MWSGRFSFAVGVVILSAGCGRSHDEPCGFRIRIDDGSDTFQRCLDDVNVHVEQDATLGHCSIVYSEVSARGGDLTVSLQLDGDAFTRAGTHPASVSLRGPRVCGDVEWCHFYGECQLEITRTASVGDELAASLVPCALTEGPSGPALPTVRSLDFEGRVGVEPYTDAGLCD